MSVLALTLNPLFLEEEEAKLPKTRSPKTLASSGVFPYLYS